MPYVTFIHGIANKPPAAELVEIWRRALAQDDGINLDTKNIGSSMVYWADVMYAQPAREDDAHEGVGAEAVSDESDEDLHWRSELEGNEKAFVDSLAGTLNFDAPSPAGDDFEPGQTDEPGFERVPLPWFIKRRLMKALLRDVHHYLFNVEYSPRPGDTYLVQDEIRNRLVAALERDSQANTGGPHLLVSHSMGTVIAYDCLKRVPDCPKVDALMTIGSPLGLDEIQDQLKPEWTRQNGYPDLKVGDSWVNVADQLDPVCLDTKLAGDFERRGEKVVADQRQSNGGKWRHSIDKYLSNSQLRGHLARQLGVTWS